MDPDLASFFKTMIEMNQLNMVLCGEAGSGKTALLSALIREYYRGYTPPEYEVNVLYINSLKEQGINYYRNDVKTFCQTCSSIKGKKKVVVLDDIDFINEQSQQVFRNCIDKYSHNVHFISSCSNVQKVIESLQSRFVIVKLNPLTRGNLQNILQKIGEREGIVMTPEAEEFILTLCGQSAKTLINYMEKCKLLEQEITLPLVNHICTNISFTLFEEYTKTLKEGKLADSIHLLYSIYDRGYSVMDILDNYYLFVKMTGLLTEDEKYEIVPLICKYITIFYNIHEDEIELGLFTNNLFSVLSPIL
jgi:DNA polymerase III delta prime subunit